MEGGEVKRLTNRLSLRSQVFGFTTLVMIGLISFERPVSAQVLGDLVDTSADFQKLEQVYFVGNRVVDFDPRSGAGSLEWARYTRQPSLSFEKIDIGFARTRANEFPGTEYDENPALPFSIAFVSPRTIRLRIASRTPMPRDTDSLMFAGPVPRDNSWKVEEDKDAVTYKSAYGQVRLVKNPWRLEFLDSSGKMLTRTMNIG